jgi:hypothetical protein
MPVDLSLVKHTLNVLANMGGSSLPHDTLGAEVELRAGRPLTTQAIDDVLTLCRDKGWAASRVDDFGRRLWHITDAGINKRGAL